MDPQGRTWEDPVEKQLQHERRRQQVRASLSSPGDMGVGGMDLRIPGMQAGSHLTYCSRGPVAKAPPQGHGQWVSVSG